MPRNGRLGLQAYARILAEVAASPTTPARAGEALCVGKQSMREILWRMEHMGLVHVTGWTQPELKRGFLAPMFAAGQGVSCPYPRQLRRHAPGSSLARSTPKPELMAFASVIRCLRDGMTRREIRAETGIAVMRLGLLLRELRRLGLAHRSAWSVRDDGAGAPAEVLSYGPGKDAPRPKALTEEERGLRYRTKRRARELTAAVTHAIAGRVELPRFGVQQFQLLGGLR